MVPISLSSRLAISLVVRGCCVWVAGLWPLVASIQAQSYAPPLRSDTKDCRVDLYDLAVLAYRWLELDDANNLAGLDLIDRIDLTLLSQQWLTQAGGPCHECKDWQVLHPEWIFCDDFEDNTPLKRQGRYFEHDNDGGDFVVVDGNGNIVTTKYNDFDNLHWLGYKRGVTPIFAPQNAGTWFCVEAHVRLNDPGQSNGVQEFWINGKLEARRTGLNFVGTYATYGINAIFLENYWNAGSPKLQERYFDSFVVSTRRIGCLCPVEP